MQSFNFGKILWSLLRAEKSFSHTKTGKTSVCRRKEKKGNVYHTYSHCFPDPVDKLGTLLTAELSEVFYINAVNVSQGS